MNLAFRLAGVMVAASGSALHAGTVTITTDTTIACEDFSLEGMDVVVDGAILTIDCAHAFNSLTLINNGVVTHSVGGAAPTGEIEAVGLHLTIATDLTIDGGCLIRANARGFNSGEGPGAGGEDDVAGGGGHGGMGGDGRNATTSYPDAIGGPGYGSVHAPVTFGSGGGRDDASATNGGRGGGAIRLTVGGVCTIDGTIASNGADFPGAEAGGGAGGSIWIECGTLAGTGGINARGGAGQNFWAGGGGGGRISVSWDSSTFTGAMTAWGGDGYTDGGAGTIFTRDNTTGIEHLLIENNGQGNSAATSFAGSTVIDGDLAVLNGAFLGHPSAEMNVELLVSGDAIFDASSGINVDRRGFGPDQGPGAGIAGVQVAGGAGHAGAGGNGSPNYPDAIGGGCYGDIEAPVTLGSGGGSDSDDGNAGGAGGGAFHLAVDGTCTHEGVFTANGGNHNGNEAAGGSGGSLFIEAGALVGAGSLSATGGGGNTVFAGGGGGGRIAIIADIASFTGAVTACGGAGRIPGGAGTIYIDGGSSQPTLLLDNCGRTGEATELSGVQVIEADVTIEQGASLAHAHLDGGLDVTIVGDCTIGAEGRIDLNHRGFARAEGPAPGGNDVVAGGGGHGGAGGNGVDLLQYPGAIGGDCYGDVRMPTTFGSGGGIDTDDVSMGSRGGGAIHLTVTGQLTVDGVVSANGENHQNEGGGGAGGSIWIDAATFAGAGAINANGGSGNTVFAGGGGGGRVAVTYDEESFMSVGRGVDDRITACGGVGRFRGGAGTIWLKDNDQALAEFIVDNCGANASVDEATEFSGFNDFAANLEVRDGALLSHKHEDIGLHLAFDGSVRVGPTAVMGGTGRGFPSMSGPGAGGSDVVGAGGGHGGAGGDSIDDVAYPAAIGGGCYGSVEMPVAFGSGGAEDGDEGTLGGAGGGALRLTVGDTLTVDGVISADGQGHRGQEAGGGAGGSVWIETGTLAGTGVIRANGGGGNTVFSGAGGGGRVAISFDDNQLTGDARGRGTGSITACGGIARDDGGAGTVFLVNSGMPRGVLIIDNCGVATTEGAEFSGAHTFDADLVVRNGGLLTHPHEEAGLDLTFTGDVEVELTGTIGGVGRGWPGGTGPGAGASGIVAGGAGYGGNGADGFSSYPDAIGGPAYGSLTMPTDLGSGGGNDTDGNRLGGAGGGALKLTCGDLHVDGVLAMDGGDFRGQEAGGGSGGSLWITCGLVTGSGRISVLGGGANTIFAGGGGGGRIVINNTAAAFAGQLTVCGGTGRNEGAQGTALLNAAFLCPGDTNCDQVVDFDDLNVLLDYWGQMDSRGDLNGDGFVNFTDLEILLEAWGTFCS